MVSKKVTIIDPEGFHMRPASKFSGEMAKFKANITIEADGKTYRKIKKEQRNRPYSIEEMMLYDVLFDEDW